MTTKEEPPRVAPQSAANAIVQATTCNRESDCSTTSVPLSSELHSLLTHSHRRRSYSARWTPGNALPCNQLVVKHSPQVIGRSSVYFGSHPAKNPKQSIDRATTADVVAINALNADLYARDLDGTSALRRRPAGLASILLVAVERGGGFGAEWFPAQFLASSTTAERESSAAALCDIRSDTESPSRLWLLQMISPFQISLPGGTA